MIRKLKRNIYSVEDSNVIFETAWDIYPYIVKLIDNSERKVLDAGCGIGKLMDFLSREKIVYGIDFSEEAVKKAKKRGYKKVVKANLEKIPFPNNFFDIAVCIEVLQYVKNPLKIVKELKRVTKKRILITVPNHRWFHIKSILSRNFSIRYKKILKNERKTDVNFIKELAYNSNLKISQTVYISRKFNNLRKLLGKYFASEIIAVLEK